MSRFQYTPLNLASAFLLSLSACIGSTGESSDAGGESSDAGNDAGDASVAVCASHQPCTGHASGAVTADLSCQFFQLVDNWCVEHAGTGVYQLDAGGGGYAFSYEEDTVIGFVANVEAVLAAPDGGRYGLVVSGPLPQFPGRFKLRPEIICSTFRIDTCGPYTQTGTGSLDVILGRELPDGGFADVGTLFSPDGGIVPDAGQPDGVFLHFDL